MDGHSFYKNAVAGGDWIIQERIGNREWVARHLPPNAPLSTFCVITASWGALDVKRDNATNGCVLEDIEALS
ncbi:hypothetical protein ACHAW6_011717 [Cyclotella cf. meneghiniana]